jgi:hypothetical protein
MKKLTILISIIFAVVTGYSQKMQEGTLTILVKRDNGGRMSMTIQDIGNNSYLTMADTESEISVRIYSNESTNTMLILKMSSKGEHLGVLYLNPIENRFTVSLSNGESYNGDILSIH